MPRNGKNFMDKYRELEYMQDIDHFFQLGIGLWISKLPKLLQSL